MCALQLGLVEAAHIIPVFHRRIFSTAHGLCLCPNHHAAYDKGIVAVMPDFTIQISGSRVATMEGAGLGGGIDSLLSTLSPSILIPSIPSSSPNPLYLAEANSVRRFET